MKTANAEKGVAPSSLKVCKKYRGQLADAPVALGLLQLPCDSINAQRRWAVNWRRRWGIVWVCCHWAMWMDPIDALQAKAARKHTAVITYSKTFFVCFFVEMWYILRARKAAQILSA